MLVAMGAGEERVANIWEQVSRIDGIDMEFRDGLRRIS